LIKRTKS